MIYAGNIWEGMSLGCLMYSTDGQMDG